MTKLFCNSKLIPGSVKEAFTFSERAIGLIGKSSLDEGLFLLFRKCSSIHTFFMRISIDVVMLDRQGVVKCITGNLKPWRLVLCPAACDTIEMKAGTVCKYGIKTGDKITFS